MHLPSHQPSEGGGCGLCWPKVRAGDQLCHPIPPVGSLGLGVTLRLWPHREQSCGSDADPRPWHEGAHPSLCSTMALPGSSRPFTHFCQDRRFYSKSCPGEGPCPGLLGSRGTRARCRWCPWMWLQEEQLWDGACCCRVLRGRGQCAPRLAVTLDRVTCVEDGGCVHLCLED